MSAKNRDEHNRWRNKTVAFRMSPEESNELDMRVKLSGLTKQNYLINRALQRDIVVVSNPKVYVALKKKLEEVLNELKSLNSFQPSAELLETIKLISKTLYEMKGDTMTYADKENFMKNYITDENTGISYTLVGDVYIPNLVSTDTNYEIGCWGRKHKEYIKQYKPAFYTTLLTQCKLNSYLHDVDVRATEMYDTLVKQLSE